MGTFLIRNGNNVNFVSKLSGGYLPPFICQNETIIV